MNILVFSQASWDSTNAFGNTVSNFFDNWTDSNFAHFYTRIQKPDNPIVSCYYNLSVKDIILKKNRKGWNSSFEKKDINNRFKTMELELAKEKNQINRLHQIKFGKEFIYWATEKIWLSEKWIDNSFEKFIADFKPDIFFAFATSVYILKPLMDYLKKNTQAKIVLFIADDVFHDYERKSLIRKKYLIRDFTQVILNADKLYGCSNELCIAYGKKFGVNIQPLYKGCIFREDYKIKKNSVIKIVYAGNLYYGRSKILGKIAENLDKINGDGVVAQLEIYTSAVITETMKRILEKTGSSKIMGSKPYAEIKRILYEADIVLHVESFDKEQMEEVRYSFSTKIIDCIQSGSAVVAVGPSGIASIEYLRNIDGVCIIDKLDDLILKLKPLIENPSLIQENANKVLKFGKQYHRIENVRNSLREDFNRLISDENSPS